jgi:leucyl-tRNA synthetase
MSDFYPFKEIEKKWQKFWEENKIFKTTGNKQKYYVLEMFPYPSGYLHMGHVRVYCIGDLIAHYMRMKGYDVIHPMGYDAFGLPAENAAIKNKIHPAEWTYKNIDYARNQFKKLGISYDWDREIITCDESYYKWNQWFFIKFYEKGLVYRKETSVNWCEKCETVLANEQVHDGKCWRCDTKVIQKKLAQWFFKITNYAQELLDRHKEIEWLEKVKIMQQNWIGKSKGVIIYFTEERTGEKIPVFTTRVDTIFGATYVVLAPEHPLIEKIKTMVSEKKKKEIEEFQEKVRKIDITVETLLNLEKEGIDTGIYAINPVNGRKIPIWIGNYVLMEYGTGAIMAVPTHDSRDFAFAKKYGLPMIVVIQRKGKELKVEEMKDAYEDSGFLVNSGEFNGLDNETAKDKIAQWMEEKGIGKITIQYKLKDWLISRQRYWGTPIPVVYCEKCGIVLEKVENLPVKLPKDIKFTGKGNPLETSSSFLHTKCPECGGNAKRETDTMDTFVDSSWYFARYCDPKNDKLPFDFEKAKRELPVDQYVGGAEHACMHLIYARFFTYVMRDLGLLTINEPFKKLLNQGMVIKDGNKMSKSKGNTVSPDELIEKYGADTARLFMIFAAPPQADLEWSDTGVEGAFRFLNRVWRKIETFKDIIKDVNTDINYENYDDLKKKLIRKTHQVIKKAINDIEKEQQFNTMIAAIMELFNTFSDTQFDLNNEDDKKLIKFVVKTIILLLAPVTPHFSEELWMQIGEKPSIFKQKFPEYDEKFVEEEKIEFVIQINGKIRDRIYVKKDITENEICKMVENNAKIKEMLTGKQIVKKIFVKNKLYNIVVK